MTDVRVPDSQRIGAGGRGLGGCGQVDVPRTHHRRRLALRHGTGRAAGGRTRSRPAGHPRSSPLAAARPAGTTSGRRSRSANRSPSRSSATPSPATSPSRSGAGPPPTRRPPSPASGSARLPCATRPSLSTSSDPPRVAWSDEERELGEIGIRFLMRQASCIAGGTTEMARNAISERVLGLPRERRVDLDVPFRDVPRSAPSR